MDFYDIKLGDCLSMIENGATIKQQKGSKGLPITRIETLSNNRFNRDRLGYADIFDANKYSHYILDDKDILMSHINSKAFLGRSVLYKRQGNEQIIHGMNVLRIKTKKDILDQEYAYYYFQTSFFKKNIHNIRKDAVNQSSINISDIKDIIIQIPSLKNQKNIATVLSNIDCKIALNTQINDNLEAMARQLYDYWFVQFDFPDENGRPYKSSGGKMILNKDLHLCVPEKWDVCELHDFILDNNTGDWGYDSKSDEHPIEVTCIRGADIIRLINLPQRYIKTRNASKFLHPWNIVIEVSGGSPIQATGRCALITPGVLKRNGGKVTCSNFCHAFTMQEDFYSAYFYYTWKVLYDNNNMFNYEGKTSGIKNFMTSMFLANKWVRVPQDLMMSFYEKVKVIYKEIDNNIEEISSLSKQRNELLPLLMNGQATVNYHLSDD